MVGSGTVQAPGHKVLWPDLPDKLFTAIAFTISYRKLILIFRACP